MFYAWLLVREEGIKQDFLEIKPLPAKTGLDERQRLPGIHMRQQHIHPQHTVLKRGDLLPNSLSASSLKALSSSRISASASSSSSSKRTILWPRNPPAPVTRQLTPARDIALGCSSEANWLRLELPPAGSPPAWGNEHTTSTWSLYRSKAVIKRRDSWKTNVRACIKQQFLKHVLLLLAIPIQK